MRVHYRNSLIVRVRVCECVSMCVCVCVCVCVYVCAREREGVLPVQLEGEGAVDGGEAQQANPSEEDAAEHAWLEVQDEDLEHRDTHALIPPHSTP